MPIEVKQGDRVKFQDHGTVIRTSKDSSDVVVRDSSGSNQTVPSGRIIEKYDLGGSVKENTDLLAREFSRLVRRDLTKKEIGEILKSNGQKNPHDYMDANMTVDEAFVNIMGRLYVYPEDGEEQHEIDMRMMDNAQTIAERNKYYPDEKLVYPRDKSEVIEVQVGNGPKKKMKELGEAKHFIEDDGLKKENQKLTYKLFINGKLKFTAKRSVIDEKFVRGGTTTGNSVKAESYVEIIKEANESKSNNIVVEFYPAYNEKEHSKLPERLKTLLKEPKSSEFNTLEPNDVLDILFLMKNKKERGVKSIKWGKKVGDKFAKGGRVPYFNQVAEDLVKHYLPGVEPAEYAYDGRRTPGVYDIEKGKSSDGSRETAITIAFGSKFMDAVKKIKEDYNSFEKFAKELAEQKGYGMEVQYDDVITKEDEEDDDDVYGSITFVFSKDSFSRDKKYAKGGTMSESPRIYVADLAAYNEGKLIGEWLDLSDYSSGEEVMEAINDLLKKWSEEQDVEREEYAIHDTENIPGDMISEYSGEDDFEKVVSVLTVANDRDIPFEVILKWMSDKGEDDASNAADAYYGTYKDEEDFAYEMVEQGMISDLSQYLTISETDRRIIAGEESDSRVEDADDDDLINQADMEDELSDLETERDEAEQKENEISEKKDAIEELEDELSDLEEDEEGNADEIEKKKAEIEEAETELAELEGEYEEFDFDKKKDSLVDKAREKVRDEVYDEVYGGLSDPVQYFVHDQGIYSEEDLAKQSFMMVDYEYLAKELGHDYTFIRHDGETYVFTDNYARGGKIRTPKAKKKAGIQVGSKVTIIAEKVRQQREDRKPAKNSSVDKLLKAYESVLDKVGKVYDMGANIVGVQYDTRKISIPKEYLQLLLEEGGGGDDQVKKSPVVEEIKNKYPNVSVSVMNKSTGEYKFETKFFNDILELNRKYFSGIPVVQRGSGGTYFISTIPRHTAKEKESFAKGGVSSSSAAESFFRIGVSKGKHKTYKGVYSHQWGEYPVPLFDKQTAIRVMEDQGMKTRVKGKVIQYNDGNSANWFDVRPDKNGLYEVGETWPWKKDDDFDDLEKYVIPTWAVKAVMNDKTSGLTKDKITKVKAFVDKVIKEYGHSDFLLSDEGEYSAKSNDIEGSVAGKVNDVYISPSQSFAKGGATSKSNIEKLSGIMKKQLIKQWGKDGTNNVLYSIKPNDKMDFGGYKDARPYAANFIIGHGIQVSFMLPERKMLTYSTAVKDEYEDRKSFENHGGLIYIRKPLDEKVAGELVEKLFSKRFAKGGFANLDKIASGKYLDLAVQGNKLHIFLTEEGREWIKENGEITERNFDELFEDIRGNSELMYFPDLGEVGIGMSSAPCITDGYYYGDTELESHKDVKVWWFPGYEVKDAFAELNENGEVDFDLADSYAKGGKVKFNDKVKAISSRLRGKGVPKKFRKDYGSRYDKDEADTAARRIAGSQLRDRKNK